MLIQQHLLKLTQIIAAIFIVVSRFEELPATHESPVTGEHFHDICAVIDFVLVFEDVEQDRGFFYFFFDVGFHQLEH